MERVAYDKVIIIEGRKIRTDISNNPIRTDISNFINRNRLSLNGKRGLFYSPLGGHLNPKERFGRYPPKRLIN